MLYKETIKNVLDVSFPVVGEMVVYTLMSIFSIMMIGNYGGNIEISAVTLGNSIMYTLVEVFISSGISMGITSIVSRNIGARRYNTAEKYASIGFNLGLIISLSISLGIFKISEFLLYLKGSDGIFISTVCSFIKVSAIAIFFFMLTNIINSILRSYGETYIPFLVSVFIAINKIIFDWLLIFGHAFPNMGVMGSAISSIISYMAGFVFSIFYISVKSPIKLRIKYMFHLDIHKIKELLKLSILCSAEEGVGNISRLLCTFIIINGGTVAIASDQIANTIKSISLVPSSGNGLATTTLVGIKIGEGKYKKAKEYTYVSVIWSIFIMLIFSMVFISMPNFLAGLFIDKNEKEVIYLASLCIIIAAFEQPFIAISSIFEGALRGIGDTKGPFFMSAICSLCIVLTLMFYCFFASKISIIYVWCISAMQGVFEAILMLTCFKNKFQRCYNEYL